MRHESILEYGHFLKLGMLLGQKAMREVHRYIHVHHRTQEAVMVSVASILKFISPMCCGFVLCLSLANATSVAGRT